MTTTLQYRLELPSTEISQSATSAMLNNAGRDGWEFAGTFKIQEHAQCHLVYKKPSQGEAATAADQRLHPCCTWVEAG